MIIPPRIVHNLQQGCDDSTRGIINPRPSREARPVLGGGVEGRPACRFIVRSARASAITGRLFRDSGVSITR
jgi:hypothetical protein